MSVLSTPSALQRFGKIQDTWNMRKGMEITLLLKGGGSMIEREQADKKKKKSLTYDYY